MDRLEELRVLYQGRRLSDARALYEREPGGTDPEWYFTGSLVYWHLGEYALSRWVADYGLVLKPRGEIRIKLLYQLGTAEEHLGDYRAATEHLKECLTGLPAYPSLAAIMQGVVFYNLALAHYNCSGSPESLGLAIGYYRRAADEFRRERLQDHLRRCLQNIAWALCDLGEADQAADAIDEAAPLCTSEQTRQLQTVLNAYQMHIAGQPIRSLAMLQPLMEGPADSDTRVFALCLTAMAALELHESDPEALGHAQAMMQQAIRGALRPGADPRCWTTANRLQKRVVAVMNEKSRGA